MKFKRTKEGNNKIKKKFDKTLAGTITILILSVYGLIVDIPWLNMYGNYLVSEISFINKYGMQYEFIDEKEQPTTKGPAFFIKPPLLDKGEEEFKIFIDQETHDKHKMLVAVFGFSSSVLAVSGIYSGTKLIKRFYKPKDKVTGKRLTSR